MAFFILNIPGLAAYFDNSAVYFKTFWQPWVTRHFDCKVRALHCVELFNLGWQVELNIILVLMLITWLASYSWQCDNLTLVKQATFSWPTNCQVCRSEKTKKKGKTDTLILLFFIGHCHILSRKKLEFVIILIFSFVTFHISLHFRNILLHFYYCTYRCQNMVL